RLELGSTPLTRDPTARDDVTLAKIIELIFKFIFIAQVKENRFDLATKLDVLTSKGIARFVVHLFAPKVEKAIGYANFRSLLSIDANTASGCPTLRLTIRHKCRLTSRF